MSETKKKGFKLPTAYTILILLMIIIAIVTQFIPEVRSVSLPEVIMAPINGMVGVRDGELFTTMIAARDSGGMEAAIAVLREAEGHLISVGNSGANIGAIGVSLFVLIIGGFLGVIAKTGALDAGIGSLVNKLKGGRELLLIPVLMLVFSLGGTTYGMAEETLAFYALITITMLKAGFDPLVAISTILIGAYAGTLGSTLNPFAVGAARDAAAAAGLELSTTIIMIIGAVLWLAVLAVSIWYTMRYAKKVYQNKNATLLSPAEVQATNEAFASSEGEEVIEFTGRRKLVLALFGFTFVVMVLGVIPWGDFDITIFENTSALMGVPLGEWWFAELTIWFFLMSIVVGVVYGMKEKDLISSFIAGSADMVGVAFIIGLSRGISFMMTNTGLDLYILEQAVSVLSGVSGPLFAIMSFLLYIPLTFLISSTSGLAAVSIPIFAPLADNLGMTPEIVVSAFTAAAGIVALFNPTSGILMGALEITKVDYGTWLKFVGKLVGIVFVLIIIILTVSMLILG